MKILIYSSVFHPAIGGIENLTLSLAQEFVKSGHEVKVVTEQVQKKNAPLPGIEVVHASSKWAQLKLFFWSDVVYMPNITLKGVWLFLFNPFKKWVVSHNDFHLINSRGPKTRLKNIAIKAAGTNIAVSHSVARALKVDSTVVYNCYKDDVFRLYPEEPRCIDFLFVGRLVSQKGCELLIDACSRLRKPFRLNIVGHGYEYDALNAKVERLGLGDSVGFLGFMRDEKLARTMNRHRVMIVPSMGPEGFGIVALEGMACGCKMVVADAGGLAEAVDGFGEVFPMGDVEALTTLLQRSLDERDNDTMSNAKLAYLRDRSTRNVAQKYLNLFA